MEVPPPARAAETLTARDALGESHDRLVELLGQLEAITADFAATPRPPGYPERAHAVVACLDAVLGIHLLDEEMDMFPAVLSAESPARHAQAFALVSSLLVDHRDLTVQWHALRVALLASAGGLHADFPIDAVPEFATRLRDHLQRESAELPGLLETLNPERSRRLSESITARHAAAANPPAR
jgi:Hemerythrin HHE cation binding domain